MKSAGIRAHSRRFARPSALCGIWLSSSGLSVAYSSFFVGDCSFEEFCVAILLGDVIPCSFSRDYSGD